MDWLRASYSAIELYPRYWYALAELNRRLTAYRAAFLPLEEARINWWAGEASNLSPKESLYRRLEQPSSLPTRSLDPVTIRDIRLTKAAHCRCAIEANGGRWRHRTSVPLGTLLFSKQLGEPTPAPSMLADS